MFYVDVEEIKAYVEKAVAPVRAVEVPAVKFRGGSSAWRPIPTATSPECWSGLECIPFGGRGAAIPAI